MNKAAFSRAFAVILTAFLFIAAGMTVHADELESTPSAEPLGSEPTEATDSSESTVSVLSTTEPIIPAEFPALTVNAISNFFPKSSAEYNVKTQEITVTYWLRSTKDILSVQWYLAYDPEVLTFNEEKNPPPNICSSIAYDSVLSLPEKGRIGYCATSLSLFDFSSQDMPFVQLVFDVNALNPDEPIITKVDLTVEDLIVSDIDSATGLSDSESEIPIVDNSIIIGEIDPLTERLTKMTTLTASNFVQATEAPSQSGTILVTDESGSVVASETVEAQSTAATHPSTAPTQSTDPSRQIGEADDEQKKEPPNQGSVPTGGVLYAFITLAIICVSTSILFVMRKKEIMY